MTEIFEQIKNAQNIALFTHIMPDGDAIGSVFAAKYIAENLGKKATVFIETSIPKRLMFTAGEYKTEFDNENYDLMISLDCGDLKRLGYYKPVFEAHNNTISIDHHFTNTRFAKYNYVIADASSTGEIVYELLKEAKIVPDKKIAGCLYCAIASDTGCFMFSNTKRRAHKYADELIGTGIDFSKINQLLFSTVDKISFQLRGYAISHIELYCDDKIAVLCIGKDVLNKFGATDENTEGLSDIPRVIEGVEVGIVVKEWLNTTKGSIRTNNYVDAAKVASVLGGGGHIRAAGCATDLSMEEAKKKLVEAAEKQLREDEN